MPRVPDRILQKFRIFHLTHSHLNLTLNLVAGFLKKRPSNLIDSQPEIQGLGARLDIGTSFNKTRLLRDCYRSSHVSMNRAMVVKRTDFIIGKGVSTSLIES